MGTKYKSGDRFVLKIEKVVTTDNTTLYKTNCNDYLLLPGDLDELPKIIDGFEETSYIAGAQDAWEVAGLIGKMPNKGGFDVDELNRVFGTRCMTDIFKMSYKEVKDKIESYEESRRKIVRGDEVKFKFGSGKCGVVTKVYPDGDDCCVLWEDGSYSDCITNNIIKTNRNFADKLDNLLKDLNNK